MQCTSVEARSVFLNRSPPSLLRQTLLLSPGLAGLASLAGQLTQDSRLIAHGLLEPQACLAKGASALCARPFCS